MAIKIPTKKEIKKEIKRRYNEYRSKLIRDGKVFINSKGKFVDVEKVDLRKD